ncbi:hypothetical protein [Winogradskyella sp.]|uniref:hypothetical protein n=1 Tax=Winogradskyella sp. TaxID=1883156 RepID=UPI0025FC8F09|nr:hypothetical protein [Winogradskyella sp.]
MTLQETYNFFESLKTETTKKSEIKVYEKFIHIIIALKNRALSQNEIHSIETELENLNLKSNPDNRKKFFNKALSKFENYLKETLSLTSKGYYTNLSVSLGVLFGIVVGVLIGERFEKSLGLSLGICMGLFIGAFIGRRKDAQAEAAGNML